MSSTNFNNETKNEIIENENPTNLEDSIENQRAEDDANLKIQNQPTKTKRNLNPTPKECSICERMASGYFFYGVICCDGCKHFFHRCITSKNKYKCENDGNCV
uniref:Nuclear receptor domain-containing protein n=1 Tax=Meloidogyne incognita TaxID=6306 RepID=A0A914LWL3_MELIC